MSARWRQTIVIHFCLILTGAPLVARLDQDGDQHFYNLASSAPPIGFMA